MKKLGIVSLCLLANSQHTAWSFVTPCGQRVALQPNEVLMARSIKEKIKAVKVEDFPYSVEVTAQSDSWIQEAANHLRDNGVCVLLPSVEDQHPSLLNSKDCQDTKDAALSRLSKLKGSIQNQGVDPNGRDGTFRFMEVVSRDESGGRFDMPVPWKNIEKIGIPLAQDEAAAIINFHSKLEETIDPVIRRLWSEDETNVAASGFLINQPGSSNQIWHRDGPNDGLINVFCPLVDLTAEIGPTQVWSKTHLREISSDSDSRQSAPLMKRGQMPLMDYRTFHRG